MHHVLAPPGLHSERGYDPEPLVPDVHTSRTSDFQPKSPSHRAFSLLPILGWFSMVLQTAARLHCPSAGITDVQHSWLFTEHSGPHACVTGTLLTEPSLQLQVFMSFQINRTVPVPNAHMGICTCA